MISNLILLYHINKVPLSVLTQHRFTKVRVVRDKCAGLDVIVSEVTIAGNLLEMLKNLTPANDLLINDNINSPSILIEGMTLAGL